MPDPSYLIFRLQETLFGVESTAVREILPRLWLSPVEEQLDFVRGIVNLRGHILPVVDLNVRFGRPELSVALTDRIVVLEWENKTVGLLVQEVCDVCTLSPAQLSAPPLPREGTQSLVFALAHRTLAQSKPQLFSLLLLERLFTPGTVSLPDTLEPLEPLDPEPLEPSGEFEPATRAILMRRSQEFAQPLPAQNEFYQPGTSRRRVAVVELGEALLAIDLELIQEFLRPTAVVPVPGAPPSVRGLIRFRAEIVPLVTLDPSFSTEHDLETALGPESVLVLLNVPGTQGGRLALLMDRVLDIVTTDPHAKRLSYEGRIASFLEPKQLRNLVLRQEEGAFL